MESKKLAKTVKIGIATINEIKKELIYQIFIFLIPIIYNTPIIKFKKPMVIKLDVFLSANQKIIKENNTGKLLCEMLGVTIKSSAAPNDNTSKTHAIAVT